MHFRCPHCKQRTITLAERLKANGYRPRACPQCGGKNTPAAWSMLVMAIIFPFALFAPLIIAGSATLPMFWVLFGAGLLLAAIGSLLGYLCVPLLRHGTRFARFEFWSFVAAVVGVTLYAALKPESPGPPLFSFEAPPAPGKPKFGKGQTGRHFSDPAQQAEYKEALTATNIPFRLETQADGREFVWVEKEHEPAVKEMERGLWGVPLPAGKPNVAFGDPKVTEEFGAWLTARGIPHSVHGTKKRPVIAWDGPDNLTVEFMKSRIPAADCDKPAPLARAKGESDDGRKGCGRG